MKPPPNPIGEAVFAKSANDMPDLDPNTDSIVLSVVLLAESGLIGVFALLNGWNKLVVVPNVIFEFEVVFAPNWIDVLGVVEPKSPVVGPEPNTGLLVLSFVADGVALKQN